MPRPSYWLDLFTASTWQEFLDAGGEVSGFREGSWKTVQQIKPGDFLLCYLVVVKRFVGILEVVSDSFQDHTRIWQDAIFPCRVKVKPIINLTPETGLPIQELRDRLTIFKKHKEPRAWGIYVRKSPTRWDPADGEAVVQALREAEEHPVDRAISRAQLQWRPRLLKANRIGAVTIPNGPEGPQTPTDSGEVSVVTPPSSEPAEQPAPPEMLTESTAHTEMQWLLLKLGSAMGLDVWVARNDRSRTYEGQRLGDVPRMKRELPLQFDEATNRTIQLIDVLWLKGNAIVAAFEVESTTSIYSGLLRMSDLLAMQPNLNIPLYLVAPDERRNKVLEEVNRPTFSRLSPPMHQTCRFIPFTALRERMAEFGHWLRFLRPEVVEEELSESCAVEQA